jgi:hypothetical protein
VISIVDKIRIPESASIVEINPIGTKVINNNCMNEIVVKNKNGKKLLSFRGKVEDGGKIAYKILQKKGQQ